MAGEREIRPGVRGGIQARSSLCGQLVARTGPADSLENLVGRDQWVPRLLGDPQGGDSARGPGATAHDVPLLA